jgi:protein-disulfide isomerase
VSAPLFVMFLVGVTQAAVRGLKITCGCFGGGGVTTAPTQYTLDLLRDSGLLLLVVYLIVWPASRYSIDEFLARNDWVEPPSPKRMRTEHGQRKYNALLEARRRDAQVRTRYLTGSLALVVALIGVIGIGVQANRAKIQGDLVATNATPKNGVVVGKAAPVTVDVFEDFLCPNCYDLEQAMGTDLSAQIDAGKIQVRYHTMSFLDSATNGNRYSTRSANAALCASDVNVDTFAKLHSILFGKDSKGEKVQPAENSSGRTDIQLIDYGKQAGITGDPLTTYQTCVQSEQHKALVEAITDDATKGGVFGTPTVRVNGTTVSKPTKASVDAAIAAAAAKAPPATTSPSSSSTSSAPAGSATATPTGTGTPTP